MEFKFASLNQMKEVILGIGYVHHSLLAFNLRLSYRGVNTVTVPVIVIHPNALESGNQPQGKFIQVIWSDKEYWVFSTKPVHQFHNHILEWFCESEGIPRHWSTKETLDVHDDQLRVLGGGRYSVTDGEITLYDNSTAFGRFTSDRADEKMIAADSPWSELRVIIKS
jgi:hypothetical protein